MTTCVGCGKEFDEKAKHARTKFCDRACYLDHRSRHPETYYRTRQALNCSRCDKPVGRTPDKIKGKVYCSVECFRIDNSSLLSRRPELLDPEARKQACEHCGGEFIVRVREFGKARYCSKSCAIRATLQSPKNGEANPNWRHGRNPASARSIAARHYPYACVICGFNVIVTVHHIKPRRDDGRNDPLNLAPLCPNHHAMADRGMIPGDELIRRCREALLPGVLDHDKLPSPSPTPSS